MSKGADMFCNSSFILPYRLKIHRPQGKIAGDRMKRGDSKNPKMMREHSKYEILEKKRTLMSKPIQIKRDAGNEERKRSRKGEGKH